MTTRRPQARLPLKRVEGGCYETADGSVRIVRVSSTGTDWLVVVNGAPLEVGGIREFTTLAEAHGALADAADAIREARARL